MGERTIGRPLIIRRTWGDWLKRPRVSQNWLGQERRRQSIRRLIRCYRRCSKKQNTQPRQNTCSLKRQATGYVPSDYTVENNIQKYGTILASFHVDGFSKGNVNRMIYVRSRLRDVHYMHVC